MPDLNDLKNALASGKIITEAVVSMVTIYFKNKKKFFLYPGKRVDLTLDFTVAEIETSNFQTLFTQGLVILYPFEGEPTTPPISGTPSPPPEEVPIVFGSDKIFDQVFSAHTLYVGDDGPYSEQSDYPERTELANKFPALAFSHSRPQMCFFLAERPRSRKLSIFVESSPCSIPSGSKTLVWALSFVDRDDMFLSGVGGIESDFGSEEKRNVLAGEKPGKLNQTASFENISLSKSSSPVLFRLRRLSSDALDDYDDCVKLIRVIVRAVS